MNSVDALCQNLNGTMDFEQGPHDILLVRIGENQKDAVVVDLTRCLGADYPVILTDLNEPIKNNQLRKAKLMIIEGLDIDFVS